MSGKRERQQRFQINEKTLEYIQTGQKLKGSDQKKDSMQQERKQRICKSRIFKIRPIEENILEQRSLDLNDDKISPKVQSKEVGDITIQEIKIKEQLCQKKQNIQKKQEKQPEEKQEVKATQQENLFSFNRLQNGIGLFTKNTKTINLFQVPTPNVSFTFGMDKKIQKSESLFSKNFQVKSQSIFSLTSEKLQFFAKKIQNQKQKQKGKEKVENAGNQDEQGSDEQDDEESIQNNKFQNVDPSKSSGKYQYSSQCDVLFQQKALKMKKSNLEIIQNIELVIQQDPITKTSWIVVRLYSTKVGILTGLLVKNKSNIKNFGGKDENTILSILVVDKEKKTSREVLKIQFEKPQQGKRFVSTVLKLIQQ